ncbi:putative secondary metabolism biosynthetic enzyme [Claviceps africana]|uniref:Secondary metabolism biosynthetic enzyme n=1 Tax=Claviceps africana TaxID=83212 RepID=A0A8K0NHW4_9HYPO|nr:putative secondary metabolism biosynthetic enzyme [Claviceps africana]UFQ31736.1 oxidoreductase [Claviceps africana]
MPLVSGKIFAVTGGASGIGAATCRLLAERGAAVLCLADVSSSGFASMHESIAKINLSTIVQCAKVDVSSAEEVNLWLHRIVSLHGDLHGAANVAGIAQGAGLRTTPTILEEDEAEWRRVFGVNLDGVFFATRAQVRAMKDLPRRHRSIVNVASIAAFSHVPDVYAYGTSKNACAYLTTCIAADVFWSGIRVNCVSPGITNTPLLPHFEPRAESLDEIQKLYRDQGYPTSEPDDVARTIVWLLSDESRPVFGANINVGACPP